MKRLSLILVLGAFAMMASAQELDWRHFDPKKASPSEWRQMMEFMEQQAEKYNREHPLLKTTGSPAEVRSRIMRGNKITTIVYNYGNITRPNLTPSNTIDLVWNRLGYGFEFTPLVAGGVIDSAGRRQHILDDGMWLASQGGYSPDGSLKWGWLPKTGYAYPKPDNLDIAAWSDRGDVNGDLTRRPHSWPESWYNSTLGRYVWPAFLGNDATSPDEEVYFVVDDYTNAKYSYYPFPSDSTKRGLGFDMEVRFFQFNNPLAEDILFLVYRVTNKSPKTIDTVYFGMYGDPHVGGDADYGDDLAFFIPPRGTLANQYPQRARSMVYCWDADGKGMGNLPTGYFGFKFLESPTNSTNGIDDDDDGIIDESPFNDAGFYIDGVTYPLTTGIADTTKYIRLYGKLKPRWSGDENGNWDPARDDVGIDGLPGTNDFGEGNGKPDIGFDKNGNLAAEPNFGIRDVNESDQIGLTTFFALQYGPTENFPKNDIGYWDYLSHAGIDSTQALFSTPGDNIIVYGSGPFSLAPEGTQRFSVALLMGANRADLLLNSETSQKVLEANYRFAAPPPKPNVTAVSGNNRVTLYWDKASENSFDPLSLQNDFEGYKIYRSEDPTFADVFTITDANGNPFLGKALEQGGVPAQFDLVNQWSGLHPVEYPGRGIKYNLGENTGLVHQYVDSSVTDGKTYYYAVVSYDHGDTTAGAQFPPSESQASIKRDPITGALTFDVNTVGITPGPPPSGTRPATTGTNNYAERLQGVSTGPVIASVLDGYKVPEGDSYLVNFVKPDTTLVYNVFTKNPRVEQFVSRDTLAVPLGKNNLLTDSIVVLDASGNVVDTSRYRVNGPRGIIKGAYPGALPDQQTFTIRYRYYTTYQSSYVNFEDDNPTFDGLRVFVRNEPLGIDSVRSGWVGQPATALIGQVQKPVSLPSSPFKIAPMDFEIRWNKTDTTASGKWLYPGDTVLVAGGKKVGVCPFRIVNMTDTSKIRVYMDGGSKDSVWRPGREIIIITPPKYAPQNPIPVLVGIMFTMPASGGLLPTAGDVYQVKTTKPFAAGDQYGFTTHAVTFEAASAQSSLDRIYVVPNPYVAYSTLESPSSIPTSRGDRKLQFRNLPPQCTIRIYTMVGELVDTIVKNDNNSYADWNLLSYEGQRLAYGVYIYHVEVPGVGEKIGRFGLIK